MSELDGVGGVVVGGATLIFSIAIAVGAARSNGERRPAQRAHDAIQLLHHLAAVDELDTERTVLRSDDGAATVRRELVKIGRQNAAVYAQSQRESGWGSSLRALLLVDGALAIGWGGYLPVLHLGKAGAVTMSIRFLLSGDAPHALMGRAHLQTPASSRCPAARQNRTGRILITASGSPPDSSKPLSCARNRIKR